MPDQGDLHKPFVRDATVEDVFYLSERLRQADLDELDAGTGISPIQALYTGYKNSVTCRVGVYNHNPFIIFGACPVQEDVGCVWALGSDDLLKARGEFLRQSRRWIQMLHKEFPVLFNYIDARNTVHIRWIKWLGFKLINLHPKYGAGQMPFYEFVRIADHV